MRIALLHSRLDVLGGAERFTRSLSVAFARRGHAVTIHTQAYARAIPPYPEDEGCAVIVTKPSLHRYLIRDKGLKSRLMAAQLRTRLHAADIVFACDTDAWRWATLALRGEGPPVLWYCNEPQRRLYWRSTERTFLQRLENSGRNLSAPLAELGRQARRADSTWWRRTKSRWSRTRDKQLLAWTTAILANSAYTATSIRLAFGIEAEVCPGGIALPPPANGAPRAGILAVGPLRPKKNLRTLLRAVATLRAQYPGEPWHVTIVGDGPDRGTLERYVAELGLGDAVHFAGTVTDAALFDLYARSRCVVYIPFDEPLGLVPIEAMASGTPVLASDHGGPAGTIPEGVGGLLVDPFDADACAQALVRLHSDDALWARLSAGARAHVVEHYGIGAIAARLDTIAQRHLSSPSRNSDS